MSNYNATSQMVESDSLLRRVIACAAAEGIVNPEQWSRDQMWYLASNSDWVDAWAYAVDNQTLDHNPDTGARPGVISDGVILSVVQARKTTLDEMDSGV